MSGAKSFRDLVGIPPSTASANDSTLLIIDAQNEYAEGQLKTGGVDESRKAISTLLETYRKADPSGKNVVHIVHQVPDGAPVFTPNTKLAKEFDELTPKGDEHVIVKEQPGSFTGTQLDDILKESGKKKVVLSGYMAHVCVSTTARQADERGYDVLLAREAIGDRDIPGANSKEVVAGSLRELADAFATVIGVNDVK